MERKGVRLQFSLLSALYFAVFSSLSYQSVLLMEEGLTSAQIGMCSAIGSIIGFGVLPVWGRIGDKMGTAKHVFIGCMGALLVIYQFLPTVIRLAPAVWVVFAYCALAAVVRLPTNALLDSWAVSELSRCHIGYGSVRVWGSIGYAIVSMGLGLVIGTCTGTASAFYVMGIFGIPLLVLSARWKPIRAQKASRKVSSGALLKNRKLMVYLLYTMGLNIYPTITIIFMGYILTNAGCSPTQVGLVTGLRAVFEIITMYAAGRLQKKLPMALILVAPGLFFGTEHLLYGFCTGLGGIIGVMVLSGFAGGIYYSMGPSYVHEIVPEPLRNTAQSTVGMTLSLVSILGNFLGGQIVGRFGINTLTTGCGILILALTGIFALGTFLWREEE